MKLSYFQVETHLTKTLSRVYLVSGEEPLLKQDVFSLLRQAAEKAGFLERIKFPSESTLDWDSLHNLLHATSLFADKQLIECDFRDALPPKAAGELLKTYAHEPSLHHVLLINLPKVDDKIAKSAWFQALDKIGQHIAIWPIPREQLPQWIMQRAKRYRMQLERSAAELTADFVEGNLVAAAQIIEKLGLLNAPEPITTETIKLVLQDESRFTVFDLMDSLLASDTARALHILETLKEDGTEPILVLWAITRELRMLCEMLHQRSEGASFDALFKKHRVFSNRQLLVKQFLSKTNLTQCETHLQIASTIDRIIKGAIPGNAWESLQLLALRWVSFTTSTKEIHTP